MIKASRNPGTLQITILLLVLYIVHLHWSPPSTDPQLRLPSSSAHRHGDPSPARTKFSPSSRGTDTAAVFQRPNAFSSPPAGTAAGMRIAIATMNTEESTYDVISISNKFGIRPPPSSRRRR